ncbi:hypothetical protein TRFO_29182 [Tritrichomonas foetus]|uniref:Uncharacterized protein n=1 Tax=Tritrichomonas foetus TaxID=1144522 RepID=A0A1J4JY49_9EUKA|nr:hypothetical protein TRFO_29182 [Tritrichomonas foetus]|eukprot:OHT03384.1 hypothetical protein TRFO_29182 [Tritrichomonas foetus]
MRQKKTYETPYIFRIVMSKLVHEDYRAIIQNETTRRPEIFNINNIENNSLFFETFPRDSIKYCDIISTLAEIAAYNPTSSAHFLSQCTRVLFQQKPLMIFRDFYDIQFPASVGKTQLSSTISSFLLLILITDLLCSIMVKYGVPEDPTFLIECGISICIYPLPILKFTKIILCQWSVIFSYISSKTPMAILDQMQKFIINKPELFFILIRYVRLDAPNCPVDDMLDYIRSHLNRAKGRNITSSMLISLSTFIMTYTGPPEALQFLYKIDSPLCDDPKFPGALDLMATLLNKMGREKSEIIEFYTTKVFPLAKTKEGMPTAARIFRQYICGNSLNPEWLFWVWGPQPRSNEYEYLKWNDHAGNYHEDFQKYFLNSPYFGECPHLLRDILVHLASFDFDYFTEKIFYHFGTRIDDSRFLTLLTTIPIINDPSFCEFSNISQDKIRNFDEKLGTMTNQVFFVESRKFPNDYGISSDQRDEFRLQIEKSTNTIDKINSSWFIDFGEQFEIKIAGVSAPIRTATPHLHIVKIIPYIINSESFGMYKWAERIILLSSYGDQVIARQAYHLCQIILKLPKRSIELVNQMLEMISTFQHDAVVFNCLKLLTESLDEIEPENPIDDNSTIYAIEYAAFISLASEHPMVRIVAYKLLMKVNKLLLNKGFYAHFENHIHAIESNVKHNILLQEFAKHPGHANIHEDAISLMTALYSKYQIPWLYFLSEFSKVIISANYVPLLKRIGNLSEKYTVSDSKNSFDTGILVILVGTAMDKNLVDDSLNVYLSTPFSTEKAPCFANNVVNIIKKAPKQKLSMIYTVLRHSNSSIITNLFAIRNIFVFNPDSDVLACTFTMVKCLEESNSLDKKDFSNLINLLTNANEWLMNFLSQTFKSDYRKKKNFSNLIDPDSEKFKKFEILLLNYFGIVQMWLSANQEQPIDKYNIFEHKEKPKILLLIYKLLKATNKKGIKNLFIKIKRYASQILIMIFSAGSIFPDNPTENVTIAGKGIKIPRFLKALSVSEKLGYHVMRPFLINYPAFIEYYIDRCFIEKSIMSDVYFDSIYGFLLDKGTDKSYLLPFSGVLFLLGLFRLKTGSLLARPFLQEFIPYYASQIKSKEIGQQLTDEMKKDIGNVPFKYFGVRLAEPIVRAGLNQLKNHEFQGSVKVMVDILDPWIRTFKLLPSQDNCMPSLNTTEKRLTKKQFLDDLMSVTFLRHPEHDFERLVEIWAILLEVKEHKNLIVSYIVENSNNKIKILLFNSLLERYPAILIKRLAQHCRLSYYAYINQQIKGDFDNEFWIVPVLVKAIKVCEQETNPYLPIFIHFTLLFHSNQTMKLLKRLCKRLQIAYSRRTLSSGSIQRIVKNIQISFKNCIPNSENFGEIWAKEAMRWVVGCGNLKLSHMSLIILNQLNYNFDDDDDSIVELLKGVMRATAYFMETSKGQEDHNSLYEFINDTFQLFIRHFTGHEQICYDYMNSFLKFIVPVDAYFSKMLRLYEICYQSPLTSDLARNSILQFLRPCFNELEADSEAKRTFDSFSQQIGENEPDRVDFDFVKAVLLRGSARKPENDREMVFNSNLEDLNRVLGHYAIMIETASADLKKRIYFLSSLILEKFEQDREIREKEAENNKHEMERRRALKRQRSRETPNSFKVVLEQHVEEEPTPLVISEDFVETEKYELNKQNLVCIFNSAAKMLPGNQEALDFIKKVSEIDPLIPTIPIFEDNNWDELAQTVIDILLRIGKQENEVVTLTDCKKISMASNLLDKTSKPKILPFTTQHDEIVNLKREESQRSGSYRVEKWMRMFSSIGMELHKKMADRVTPTRTIISEGSVVYDVLQPPTSFISEEKMTRAEVKLEILMTPAEFRQLAINEAKNHIVIEKE